MSSKRPILTGNLRDSARSFRSRIKESFRTLSSQPTAEPSVQSPSGDRSPASSANLLAHAPVVDPSTSENIALAIPGVPVSGGNSMWTGLEVALRGLETCSSVFPPLKPVVVALVQCIKEIPVRRSGSIGHDRLMTLGYMDRISTSTIKHTMTLRLTLKSWLVPSPNSSKTQNPRECPTVS
jgi:hypothetical protein